MNKVALLGFRSESGYAKRQDLKLDALKQTVDRANNHISSQLKDSSRPAFPVSKFWDIGKSSSSR